MTKSAMDEMPTLENVISLFSAFLHESQSNYPLSSSMMISLREKMAMNTQVFVLVQKGEHMAFTSKLRELLAKYLREKVATRLYVGITDYSREDVLSGYDVNLEAIRGLWSFRHEFEYHASP